MAPKELQPRLVRGNDQGKMEHRTVPATRGHLPTQLHKTLHLHTCLPQEFPAITLPPLLCETCCPTLVVVHPALIACWDDSDEMLDPRYCYPLSFSKNVSHTCTSRVPAPIHLRASQSKPISVPFDLVTAARGCRMTLWDTALQNIVLD